MVKTLGLTHLSLAVSDLNRSFQFYHDVFGMLAVYREPTFIQAQTPGSQDIMVFEIADGDHIGQSGGIKHFGFRLSDARERNQRRCEWRPAAWGVDLRQSEIDSRFVSELLGPCVVLGAGKNTIARPPHSNAGADRYVVTHVGCGLGGKLRGELEVCRDRRS